MLLKRAHLKRSAGQVADTDDSETARGEQAIRQSEERTRGH